MSALVAVGTMILVQKFIRGTLCPQLVELTVSDWKHEQACLLVSVLMSHHIQPRIISIAREQAMGHCMYVILHWLIVIFVELNQTRK